MKHIDEIAREQQRDVLFIHFENYIEDQDLEDNERDQILAWLEEQSIAYEPCMGLAEDGLIDSYLGDIYVDVPFDSSNPQYQALSNLLEDEEGEMKIEGVLFFVLSLDVALEIEADRKAFDAMEMNENTKLS